MKRFTKMAGSALLITTCLSSTSLAQTRDELQAEVSTLKDRVAALEELVSKITGATAQGTAAAKQELPPKTVTFASSDPAPTLKSADGELSFNVRGRVFLDWSTGSDENNSFDFSGTKLRAAWFGVDGNATDNIKYKFEADFGGNSVSVKDAYLQFKLSDWSVTVGQSKVPNSLEWNTAISQTSLMERGAFKSAFDFGRAMGIKAGTSGDGWSFTTGIFQGTNKFTSNTDEGWIAAARATYGNKSDSGTWMLGVSGRLRDMNDDSISYKAKAITNQSGTLTSASGTNKDSLVAAEAAFSYGSFFGAAEYAFLSASDAGLMGENASFSGGYAEVGYVLTGESRPIDLKKGTWGRPKVADPFGKNGGAGLWMLTVRYDTLDLTDSGIYGGKQESYIASLSWYMTRYVRALLDYGHSEVSDLAANGTNSADVVGLRLNVDW
ncbi:OprO/OprP family phosphate-selective porin [Emcibacter sp.]|uniref:OprO/OprP family phosphate-selective porin n=1 Tax=Emcibacter sp. TaxID=1979954 RepID=UPI002AA72AE2|nr:porin [Emcibacter sp.]